MVLHILRTLLSVLVKFYIAATASCIKIFESN